MYIDIGVQWTNIHLQYLTVITNYADNAKSLFPNWASM